MIRVVKEHARPDGLVIIDCPPGTSCPVIEAVRGSDYVLLVTEPAHFGLNDLRLAVEMVEVLSIPFGVRRECTSDIRRGRKSVLVQSPKGGAMEGRDPVKSYRKEVADNLSGTICGRIADS